jgi:hypothetical protein
VQGPFADENTTERHYTYHFQQRCEQTQIKKFGLAFFRAVLPAGFEKFVFISVARQRDSKNSCSFLWPASGIQKIHVHFLWPYTDD